MGYAVQERAGVRELSTREAWKLALARDPSLRVRYGYRVRVPRGTKSVHIPRKKHYAKTVFTEERDEAHLHAVSDILEPCIVTRGAFGFGLHECKYHPAVYIEEIKSA